MVSDITNLLELNSGQMLSEAADDLRQIVTAVQTSGKPGKVKIEITVKPGSFGMVITEAVVTPVQPKRAGSAGTYFVTEGGNISRKDPLQTELPFREMDRGTGEVREVSGGAPLLREVR